jgi:hypothetical protein
MPDGSPVSFTAIRNRLFDLIDATPHLRWMLPTSHPAAAAKMMPAFTTPVKFKGRLIDVNCPRPNLYISARVRNQADADRLIPELLRIPGRRGVFLDGQTEGIDLCWPKTLFPDGPPRCCDGRECGCYGMPVVPPAYLWPEDSIGWITQRGGADALHPAWVRQTRDQCEGAGVPYAFLGWGEWGRYPDVDIKDWSAKQIMGKGMIWLSTDGRHTHRNRKPSDYQQAALMARVGPDRSGKAIDGREWEGVPE